MSRRGFYAELAKPGGILTAQGDARRLLTDFRQLRTAQLALSRELGLTPASLVSIRALASRDAEIDLVAMMASTAQQPEAEEADAGNQSDDPAPGSKLPE